MKPQVKDAVIYLHPPNPPPPPTSPPTKKKKEKIYNIQPRNICESCFSIKICVIFHFVFFSYTL